MYIGRLLLTLSFSGDAHPTLTRISATRCRETHAVVHPRICAKSSRDGWGSQDGMPQVFVDEERNLDRLSTKIEAILVGRGKRAAFGG